MSGDVADRTSGEDTVHDRARGRLATALVAVAVSIGGMLAAALAQARPLLHG